MPSEALLTDLQAFATKLEDDLRGRAGSVDEIREYVSREYAQAKQAGRTGEAKEEFQEQLFTQGAVAWVLSAVFVRFLEDNGFLDDRDGTAVRWLAGHEARYITVAKDTERQYFQDHSHHSERDYILHVFETVRKLPGLERLFDPKHNALWHLPISADAARDLLTLVRKTDPETGDPIHPFHDPELDTRFLGDLYQDLSESARKRYALLQTPEFVEEFILDYTLEPAIEEFGYSEVRVIDPACGSGHFLLGAFKRLLALHQRHEPAVNDRELVTRALHQVAGVDLNPFAVAIANFRLLVVALREGGVSRLEDAPAYEIHVAAGDSLLHGRRPGTEVRSGELFEQDEAAGGPPRGFDHYFATEDRAEVRAILERRYHAVVGNPPYITVKDKRVNDLYRARYESCYRQYSLVCPFLERFFDLAAHPLAGETGGAGFVGAIVANSFTKRNFGRKLIEEVMPRWDLTHVVDTSGAYIPGHGTPTLILHGRHRKPLADEVRAVMGIRGEPGTPEEASKGKVWSAIVRQIDRPGSESAFVSTSDVERRSFKLHPWSLQGGGVSDLKERLDSHSNPLGPNIDSIGFFQDTHADEAFVQPREFVVRQKLGDAFRTQVRGDGVRDWTARSSEEILFPYGQDLEQWDEIPHGSKWSWFWRLRTLLWSRSTFSGTYQSDGRPWFDWHQFPKNRARTPLSIAFAFVATHNHFVLDRGGKVFNRSAPVIKLPEGASEEEHLGILGLLNSSTACFWMKQVMMCRGSTVDSKGARQTTIPFEDFYEHAGTQLREFPLPRGRPEGRAGQLDQCGQRLLATAPEALALKSTPQSDSLLSARKVYKGLLAGMIALQEELDWQTYGLYALIVDGLAYSLEPPPIQLGERAFEIAMARETATGDLETTWFERHGSIPITEIPSHWPEDYQRLVQRRIDAIESNKNIRLIEKPEYKRRWNTEAWEVQERRALRRWLLDRLEADSLWDEARLTSTARLADRMRQDGDFLKVAALYRGHEDFDLVKLVTDLVQEEGAPFLAIHRYKASGLRKRKVWERVWDLQRQEDTLDARTELPDDHPEHLSKKEAEAQKTTLDIPVPPKYKSADFASSATWRHRGKLDVPKEQFILYPGAEREIDPTPVLGWAGWNHLQQAEALATYYTQMRDTEGWPRERLILLLAGLLELLPWLKQWHNERDAELGESMGDYYAGFLDGEARRHGVTLDDLREWRP